MPSVYLSGGDLAAYGVATATAPQIQQASAIIDAWLTRPEGLIWTPDANGNPAFMAAKSPALTLKLSGGIAPGTNVVANVTGGPASAITPGMVVLLDQATPAILESCLVTSVTGSAITLGTVQFAHSANATVDLDMCIVERHSMPKGRPLTMLARSPVMALLGGRGRYGYGRRGQQNELNVNDFNVLAALQRFGGPPIWELFDIAHTDVDPRTGELWVPAGIMMAYYTEVEVSYIAGYSAANLHPDIKQACANIVNAIINMPMNGNIQVQTAGDSNFRRFEATYIDQDTQALLMPYRAKVFG